MGEMSFEQVVRTRRSIRAYREEAVPEETLRELAELATLAPTGMGQQPWRFSIVTSRKALAGVNQEVKQACLAAIERIPAFENYREYFENPQFDVFYGAPALVVIQGRGDSPSASMDCLLAAENLILAAHAKGLGTCFMGFVFIARESKAVRRALAVDDGYEIVAPIIVGFPASVPETGPERKPPEITWVR